ncbi:hypothetical protein HGRIS_004356 [Hohenbuehelia grisea]|uniref:Uncharacterized protein n=1 Tax=Hohenbuehelia grisea TaxID=104357 RepID=A0ABR3JCB6_9AGAR
MDIEPPYQPVYTGLHPFMVRTRTDVRYDDLRLSLTTVATLTALGLERAQMIDTHGATTASLRHTRRSLAAVQEETPDTLLRAEMVEIRIQARSKMTVKGDELVFDNIP